MSLLIHSMSNFAEIMFPAMRLAGVKNIAEVGAEYGGFSQHLADYAAECDGSLTSIDPSVKPEFLAWLSQNPAVKHVQQPSLDVIDTMTDIDAWVIDGDHNYFTVYHEIKAIDAVCRREGKPLLAFFHDVGWPCGRRDSYYSPDRIPAEWRHAYDFDAGVVLESDALQNNQGFRGCGEFAWAIKEGGPRNGVLTAIEDAVEEMRSPDRDIGFAFVPAVFGLGILFDSNQSWSAALAGHVMPYHCSPLLQSLETNRLANYLAVIAHQDALQNT